MEYQPQTLLDFWFAGSESEMIQRWFRSNPDFDRELEARFGELYRRSVAGEFRDWAAEPRGMLARIIVLDQLSRNLLRGSGEAFAHDDEALALAHQVIEREWETHYTPLERLFIYLPLEHSEDLHEQELCVRLFEKLLEEVPAEEQDRYASFLDYARRHRDVIARFGRFPHRNQRLGRESTPEEQAFLQEPGSSFG